VLHNSKLRYQISEKTQLTLRIDNLGDAEVIDPSNNTGGNKIPRRGRHISLVWKWDL